MDVLLTHDLRADSNSLPAVIEPSVYRQLWPDLRSLDDQALRIHYEQFGKDEGRAANSVATRDDFVNLIPAGASALEIGPFCKPLLRGPNVKYFDVMDRLALEERARSIGMSDAVAPQIDFVSAIGDLAVVDETFDYVLSSHCIEHQPDLIIHLQQVARILQPHGRYFLLIPDKRYCFDALIAESTIADVLDAHQSRRTVHSLKSVIEHRALTTHSDCMRHWVGDHGEVHSEGPGRVLASIQEFAAANGGYVDVHAWYFTPWSIQFLFKTLHEAGYIEFVVERLYPTRLNSLEFWMVLSRSADVALGERLR